MLLIVTSITATILVALYVRLTFGVINIRQSFLHPVRIATQKKTDFKRRIQVCS